jgi:hypothetical protein
MRNEAPSLLDVVALLTDLPAQGVARGQVGTSAARYSASNKLDRIVDGRQLLEVAVGALDAERLLEGVDQLDRIPGYDAVDTGTA